MTEQDIIRIEQTLDIKLPGELVEKYKSNFLDGVEEYPRIADTFITNPDKLISLNLRLRKRGLQKKTFPDYYFVIGHNDKYVYDMVDLRESPINVYRVENNKGWAYRPEDMSKNLLLPPDRGLESFLGSYVLFRLNMKQKEKARIEAGIPERQYTTEEVYEILAKLRADSKKEREEREGYHK